jgi:class 3 adenylate cyclase
MVGAYHRCVAETVAGFAGFVAKYMGDGVLVYFGYPEAHEDDAERAVRAGLAVIDEAGRLATAEPLNVRLGVASGLAVFGDPDRRTGHTASRRIRLSSWAVDCY